METTPDKSSGHPAGVRLLRTPDIEALLGVSKFTFRRWEIAGRFPKRIRLNPSAAQGGSVAWLEHEVLAWIAERAGGREPVAS